MQYIVDNVMVLVPDGLPGVPPGTALRCALYVNSEDRWAPVRMFKDEMDARDTVLYAFDSTDGPKTDSPDEPPPEAVRVWSSPEKVPR